MTNRKKTIDTTFDDETGQVGFQNPVTGEDIPLSNHTSRAARVAAYALSYVGSAVRMPTFAAAVASGAATVVILGDSIDNGGNQNGWGFAVARMIERFMKALYPTVVFTFHNLSIGGSTVGQVLGTSPLGGVAAQSSASLFRRNWVGKSLAAATPGVWIAAIAATSPDLILPSFGLNEAAPGTYATNMQALITYIRTDAAFAAKRPDIGLGINHTGAANIEVVKQCAMATRELAQVNGLPFYDAARVYDIQVDGVDPVDYISTGTTSSQFEGVVVPGPSTPLSQRYFESRIGSAISPNGTTVRAASGSNLRTYRTKSTLNGSNQMQFTLGGSGSTVSFFCRADPDDPLYSSNSVPGTGSQIEIAFNQDSGKVKAYKWVGGVQTAIVDPLGVVEVTLNSAPGATQYQMRHEFRGAHHLVEILNTNGTMQYLEFSEYTILKAGYMGFGTGGSGVTSFNATSADIGNLTKGQWFEFYDTTSSGIKPMKAAELLGAVNDWTTNSRSAGGNLVNHLTNSAYKMIYEPAFINFGHQLHAATAGSLS